MSKVIEVILLDIFVFYNGYLYDDYEYYDYIFKGIMCWLFIINYKDIGIFYLWFVFIMFLVGGVMVMVICVELF